MDTTNLVSEAQHERFEAQERNELHRLEFPPFNSVVVVFDDYSRAVYECHSYSRAIEILGGHDSSKVIGWRIV
jgi:hypothetical protein